MWNSEMVMLMRHMIDDYDTPYKYIDDRIAGLILVAAQSCQQEVNFFNSYQVDVSNLKLSPDPTGIGHAPHNQRDDGFINLVCLKAAAILTRSELKTTSMKAISWKEGSTSMDLRDMAKNLKEAAKAFEDGYEAAKLEYQAGNNMAGQAIVSPYRLGFYNAINGGPEQSNYYRGPIF